MDPREKVFVVTGGGNGIGREVVLQLLKAGARVAAVDVSAEALAETADLAARAGDRLSTHAVDVTDATAVSALPGEVVALHAKVDGLVNVAGIIQPFVPVSALDVSTMEHVMDVNYWGVVHTVKAFLPLLLERPAASLVNVSSMGAFVAVPGQTAYGASKAAVKLFTEGLYAELKDGPVAVTGVYPGGVSTDIVAHSGAAPPAAGPESSPLELTTPEEAALRIVEGIERGSYRVLIGMDAKGLDLLSRLTPQHSTDLVAHKLRSLLDPRPSPAV